MSLMASNQDFYPELARGISELSGRLGPLGHQEPQGKK